jgi:CheY-like chemotaxis protein
MTQQATTPSKSLLLVDDEPGIRELLTMILECSGYRCLPAPDGAEALELFRRHHADIEGIVTDVHMPILDGYALVRAARELSPQVKVVLSSGSLGEAERRIAADLRVSAFLPKPYTSPQPGLSPARLLHDTLQDKRAAARRVFEGFRRFHVTRLASHDRQRVAFELVNTPRNFAHEVRQGAVGDRPIELLRFGGC